MAVQVSALGSVSDLLLLIESNEPEQWHEIKQLIYEQYHEVKESWLVHMLYDLYSQTGSPRCLELLLNVREPHEKFLCDKIAEGIKANHINGKTRKTALAMLGFIVRKQPSWLYKITQHSLMKELIKVLKHEDDLVIMMSALLDLLVLMPIVPSYISPYLQDLFEIFSRVASWRYQSIKILPEVQQTHVQVGLYAFFHRLYGMFPCNFLSYLRIHYSEQQKENNAVFTHTIKPMLNTVKMHPMLVTQSKDFEKTAGRWKRMELHDIIVESSRYSLDANESAKEEDVPAPPSLLTDFDSSMSIRSAPEADQLSLAESFWTPSRKCDLNSPTAMMESTGTIPRVMNTLESPPEAAIEATPETTPFVTPVKDDRVPFFTRPQPSNIVSRQLNLDSKMKSPASVSIASSNMILSPTSSKEPSPFRFPDIVERRDSIFCGPVDLSKLVQLQKPVTPVTNSQFLYTELSSTTLTPGTPGTFQHQNNGQTHGSFSSVAISSSALLQSSSKQKPRATPTDLSHIRPSPVKFTNQRPDQFPIKPEPERIPQAVADAMKHKMLSLEKLKDFNSDFLKEDDDDEVTEITGGNDDPGNHMVTRHITPKLMESGATSRTLSSSSQTDPKNVATSPTITVTAPSETKPNVDCQSGGLHPPSKASLNSIVRVARRRIKYMSVCGAGGNMPGDIASEVDAAMNSASPMSFMKAKQKQTLKRASSCPDVHKIKEIVAAKNEQKNGTTGEHHQSKKALVSSNATTTNKKNTDDQATDDDEDGNDITVLIQDDDRAASVSVQTDEFLVSPYEHLFPFVLPQWLSSYGTESVAKNQASKKPLKDDVITNNDTPYEILDRYVRAAYDKTVPDNTVIVKNTNNEQKMLRDEIALLHNQLLYERHRREILGLRNRRLLGKTKNSRALEEQNTSLNDRLRIASREMAVLSEQLEQLRTEKHKAEVEHVRKEHTRDLEVEAMSKDKVELNQVKSELMEQVEKQTKELSNASSEIAKLEAALFNTKNQVERLEKKEDLRKTTETQLIEARKQIILQGELLRKYHERFIDKPVASEGEDRSLYKEAFRQQMEAIKGELHSKSTEVESLKARNKELEDVQMRQEDTINALKRQNKKVCEEYEEQLKCVENAYEGLKPTYVQLEVRAMELQCQLSKFSKPKVSRSTSGAIRSGVIKRSGTTANVDIEVPTVSIPPLDNSFIIGSPPSSGASLGSDLSEIMRRASEMNSSNAGEEVMHLSVDLGSPETEIGSAVSAKENFDASAGSSMNGSTTKE